MKRIEFHDREPETKEIRDILDSEPSLITFIYGPINSGKTALVNHLIDRLPDDYKIFYINLRGRFTTNYDDFIKVLFDVEREARYERIKKFLKPVAAVLPESYNGIPIPKDTFLKLFKEKEVEDAFVYIETVLRAFYESGRSPVLIVDELQVIGDMKIDGHLVYKLFNFFVRLTKELHLAHVFVISSDSLFIEQVYSEAMLKGRCRYLLVDDFDHETTATFLNGYGVTDADVGVAWEYCGGKPVCLVELINSRNREEKAKEMFTFRIGELETRLKLVKELGDEIMMCGKRCDVHYEKLISTLKMFVKREEIGMNEVDEVSKRYLVKENILFVDPLTAMMKPQSQLDLSAIRKVMGAT